MARAWPPPSVLGKGSAGWSEGPPGRASGPGGGRRETCPAARRWQPLHHMHGCAHKKILVKLFYVRRGCAGAGSGASRWVAGGPGKQEATLAIDAPRAVTHLALEVEEDRSQEVQLAASTDGGQTFRVLVRQGVRLQPAGHHLRAGGAGGRGRGGHPPSPPDHPGHGRPGLPGHSHHPRAAVTEAPSWGPAGWLPVVAGGAEHGVPRTAGRGPAPCAPPDLRASPPAAGWFSPIPRSAGGRGLGRG